MLEDIKLNIDPIEASYIFSKIDIVPSLSSDNSEMSILGHYNPKSKDIQIVSKPGNIVTPIGPQDTMTSVTFHELNHYFYDNKLTEKQKDEWEQIYKDNKVWFDNIFNLSVYPNEERAVEAYAKFGALGKDVLKGFSDWSKFYPQFGYVEKKRDTGFRRTAPTIYGMIVKKHRRKNDESNCFRIKKTNGWQMESSS